MKLSRLPVNSHTLPAQIDIYAFLTKKIEKCQEEITRYQEHVENLSDEINRVHGLREAAVQDAVASKNAEIASLKVLPQMSCFLLKFAM